MKTGHGAAGSTPLKVEKLATGLEVPWALVVLPKGDLLITERPGRVRLITKGALVEKPVLEIPVTDTGEAGLLGMALHPEFASNRLVYFYYTFKKTEGTVNRIERYVLARDHRSAKKNQLILDDIPSAEFHDGGRIHFGPDKMLYVGTGDAREPDSAQDLTRLSGKLLRLTAEGGVPIGNLHPGNRVFAYGLRNPQGFTWLNSRLLAVVDHGPSGEFGLRGNDELNWVRSGTNLGWPLIHGCQKKTGMQSPLIAWTQATPPSSVILYTGDVIPDWKGNLLITTLGSEHLQVVRLGPGEPSRVLGHETYLSTYGRLREIVQAPDGSLLVATSNCDGRGDCPAEKDVILRITLNTPAPE
ncbi:MAG: glucose sorbosone dehydrogenase [Bdellovibrionales bacterium GWC1_52_8]|nr:MAG: glucose sorbosone dehydrogenase [Bdellovibrionales bacterium GWB1_52_6]OFZ05090.1 MAG: glucose sorbosone dehydrogenase [Bdellovibrionales bacterium GWA1_52_35]OFZ40308.1 MAG: glucose sorbosone dehydrogenase [Bdellovibrionales bacterium GWC1_52_8]